MERSLSDPQVFKNQILEDMKYRAPLEFSRQITDKLRSSGVSDVMNHFSDFSHKARDMDRLATKRDEAMKRVWRLFNSMDRMMSRAFSSLQREVRALEPEHSEMQQLDVSSLRKKRRTLQERINTLERKSEPSESDDSTLKRLEKQLDEVEDKLDDYEDWLDHLNDIQDEFRLLSQEAKENLESILEWIEEAEQSNEELRREMDSWSKEFADSLIQSVHLMSEKEFHHTRRVQDLLLQSGKLCLMIFSS